jgi:hypothetical protein
MGQWSKKYRALIGLLALLFVLAACSFPALGGASTPAQTLQNSAAAMAKLTAVHVDLQTTLAAQASDARGHIMVKLTGQGDGAQPDEASIRLFMGQKPLLALISKGSRVYVQGKNQVWYWAEKNALRDAAQNFFSQSMATRLGQIMTVVESAGLTDHGQESLNGVSLDHITATLDQQTLQTLNTQLSGLLPQGVQSGQSRITAASLDLWIDQSSGFVHRAILNVTTQIDTTTLQPYLRQSSSLGVVPVTVQAEVNFSKFNQPVTIQAPANAIPFPQ